MQSRIMTRPAMPAPVASHPQPKKRPATLRELVDLTPDLPALPTVALATYKETSRDGATASSVSALVATDAALTARVLRLANSAYYGNSRQVAAVGDAVMLLGMKGVRNLCLLAGTYPWLKGRLPAYGLEEGRLMSHSLAAAVAARALAERAGLDSEAAFTAGLLHDLGKVALAVWFTPADGAVVDLSDERRILGFDHEQMGGELARRWNLPLELVSAIACHHIPCQGLEDAVHVGDVIAHRIEGDEPISATPESLARLGLAEADLDPLAEELKTEFERQKKLAEACA